MLQLNNSITCTQCHEPFDGYRTAKYCSVACQKQSAKDALIRRKVFRSLLKFTKDSSIDSYVECGICGYRTSDLAQHPQIHGVGQTEYRSKYGHIKCKNLRDSMVGNKNPGYQHGGKLSPFSKNFVNYTNNSYIEELKRTCAKTKVDNNTNSLSTKYYTKDGYTEEEAIELIRKRQSTFSLEICIDKYGVEEGTSRWSDRQAKWLNTLSMKTEEEKDLINKKKIYKSGMSSKQEKYLLEKLKEITQLELEHQFIIKRNDVSSRYFSYDIKYNNKIIEYNGDLWHANPSKYKKDDIPRFPRNKKTANEIWDNDKLKQKLALDTGYEILIVWENDMKIDKQKSIQECINFLTQ